MNGQQIADALAQMLLCARNNQRQAAVQLIHLWSLREEWQETRNRKALVALTYALRETQAWNLLENE
jgi:hypothetical protein